MRFDVCVDDIFGVTHIRREYRACQVQQVGVVVGFRFASNAMYDAAIPSVSRRKL